MEGSGALCGVTSQSKQAKCAEECCTVAVVALKAVAQMASA